MSARPQPRAPFVAAYLIKLDQDKRSMGKLRAYLLDHPALVWLLGFPLTPDSTSPYGFDVDASPPDCPRFSRVLRALPNPALHFLFALCSTQAQRTPGTLPAIP